MNEQRFKMKTLGAIFLISLLTFGCGDAGTTGGAQGDGSPTLGITSVQKGQTTKPNFALNLMNKGLGFLFGNPVIAQTSGCSEITSAKTISMGDGIVYITQAYIILDEIEFNLIQPNILSPQEGPFAVDLTNTDPLVPEIISLSSIPPDNYQLVKFKIARLDGSSPPINLGDHQIDFMGELFSPATTPPERRPSIWIEGFMQTDAAFSNCLPFTFFTDKASVPRHEFIFQGGQTIDPSTLDVVLFLNIKKAFKALDIGPSPVQSFIDEIGSAVPFVGTVFLDGRVFNDQKKGTPNAVNLAKELFGSVEVFTQPKGSFDGTMAADAFPVS